MELRSKKRKAVKLVFTRNGFTESAQNEVRDDQQGHHVEEEGRDEEKGERVQDEFKDEQDIGTTPKVKVKPKAKAKAKPSSRKRKRSAADDRSPVSNELDAMFENGPGQKVGRDEVKLKFNNEVHDEAKHNTNDEATNEAADEVKADVMDTLIGEVLEDSREEAMDETEDEPAIFATTTAATKADRIPIVPDYSNSTITEERTIPNNSMVIRNERQDGPVKGASKEDAEQEEGVEDERQPDGFQKDVQHEVKNVTVNEAQDEARDNEETSSARKGSSRNRKAINVEPHAGPEKPAVDQEQQVERVHGKVLGEVKDEIMKGALNEENDVQAAPVETKPAKRSNRKKKTLLSKSNAGPEDPPFNTKQRVVRVRGEALAEVKDEIMKETLDIDKDEQEKKPAKRTRKKGTTFSNESDAELDHLVVTGARRNPARNRKRLNNGNVYIDNERSIIPENKAVAKAIAEPSGESIQGGLEREVKEEVNNKMIDEVINEAITETNAEQGEDLEKQIHIDQAATIKKKATRINNRKRKTPEEDKAPSNDESNVTPENVAVQGEVATSIGNSRPIRNRKAPNREPNTVWDDQEATPIVKTKPDRKRIAPEIITSYEPDAKTEPDGGPEDMIFEDEQQGNTSIAKTKSNRKRKVPDTLKPSPQKPPKKKVIRKPKVDPWDYRHLTTSSKSKLASADLLGILQNPATWALLTPADIEELGTHFPQYVPRNDDNSISIDWLRNNVDWRHSVRQWQTELGGGFYDPEWQKEAKAASAERAAGKFDKVKEEEFEEFWGQKQKPDFS